MQHHAALGQAALAANITPAQPALPGQLSGILEGLEHAHGRLSEALATRARIQSRLNPQGLPGPKGEATDSHPIADPGLLLRFEQLTVSFHELISRMEDQNTFLASAI